MHTHAQIQFHFIFITKHPRAFRQARWEGTNGLQGGLEGGEREGRTSTSASTRWPCGTSAKEGGWGGTPAEVGPPGATQERPSRSAVGSASTRIGMLTVVDGVLVHLPSPSYSHPWYGHFILPCATEPCTPPQPPPPFEVQNLHSLTGTLEITHLHVQSSICSFVQTYINVQKHL
jgi:hypothetical protein